MMTLEEKKKIVRRLESAIGMDDLGVVELVDTMDYVKYLKREIRKEEIEQELVEIKTELETKDITIGRINVLEARVRSLSDEKQELLQEEEEAKEPYRKKLERRARNWSLEVIKEAIEEMQDQLEEDWLDDDGIADLKDAIEGLEEEIKRRKENPSND